MATLIHTKKLWRPRSTPNSQSICFIYHSYRRIQSRPVYNAYSSGTRCYCQCIIKNNKYKANKWVGNHLKMPRSIIFSWLSHLLYATSSRHIRFHFVDTTERNLLCLVCILLRQVHCKRCQEEAERRKRRSFQNLHDLGSCFQLQGCRDTWKGIPTISV